MFLLLACHRPSRWMRILLFWGSKKSKLPCSLHNYLKNIKISFFFLTTFMVTSSFGVLLKVKQFVHPLSPQRGGNHLKFLPLVVYWPQLPDTLRKRTLSCSFLHAKWKCKSSSLHFYVCCAVLRIFWQSLSVYFF